MAATGWTWDYCRDHVDLPRLRALDAYYAKNPPLHVAAMLIARALGVEMTGGDETPELSDQDAEMAQLLSMIPERPRA